MNFDYPYGATPIDLDEAVALIPGHLQTQAELNVWEQKNIIDAQHWAFSRNKSNLLTVTVCRELHKHMFNKTWKWAGKFRHTNKNIGVFWEQISMQLKVLLDDVDFQLKNKSYRLEEIATRLHHRLVAIHAFPNGNGRHGRLYTDMLLVSHGAKKFSWGSALLNENEHARKGYIAALREADKGLFEPLLKFVKS